MTEEQLKELLPKWQKILRLQDWIVKVSVKRKNDMILDDAQGENSWKLSKKMASIHILDPIDYPNDVMVAQDMEETLVHELLHLHFAPFDNFESGSHEDIAIEQAIDSIAMALVNLNRQS